MNDGMNLVAHVNRTETGLTKMQIKFLSAREPVWPS